MKTIKFKTDIKCGGCLAKVSPGMQSVKNIDNWSVDLNDPNRTLTVAGENPDPIEIIEKIKSAGYKAELVS